MARPLDGELLREAIKKCAEADTEGWANQVGIDEDIFIDTMHAFSLAIIEKNPISLILITDDQIEWMTAAFSSAFQMGWFARALQKNEEQ